MDERRRRSWPPALGAAAAAVAVVGPAHDWAERSLPGHMWQHVVLLSVAGPLLALGPSPRVLLRGLRPGRRPAAWAGSAHAGRPWAWAVGALVAQTVVVVGWHAPGPYEAAVRSDALHALEHLSLLGTSIALWALVIGSARPASGAAVPFLFVASLPGMALGAAMTLASSPWYPSYGSGADALQQQQVAGVVMWAFGGLVYVVAAGAAFVGWLRQLEARHPEPPSRVVRPLAAAPGSTP